MEQGRHTRSTWEKGVAALLLAAGSLALAQHCLSRNAVAQSPAPAAAAGALPKILAQLDAAALHFGSAQADFSWDQYTLVVQDHDIQKGTIAFRRGAKSTAMIAHIVTDNGQPAPRDVLFKDGEVHLYQPGAHQETIMDAGPHRGQYESYSTLGFGSSGRELAANWAITYKGIDKIDGTEVAVLDLAPKQPSPNALFTHIIISIDPVRSVSLKQQFFEPSGDTRTATYAHVKLNGVPDNAFALNIPKNTQVIHR